MLPPSPKRSEAKAMSENDVAINNSFVVVVGCFHLVVSRFTSRRRPMDTFRRPATKSTANVIPNFHFHISPTPSMMQAATIDTTAWTEPTNDPTPRHLFVAPKTTQTPLMLNRYSFDVDGDGDLQSHLQLNRLECQHFFFVAPKPPQAQSQAQQHKSTEESKYKKRCRSKLLIKQKWPRSTVAMKCSSHPPQTCWVPRSWLQSTLSLSSLC